MALHPGEILQKFYMEMMGKQWRGVSARRAAKRAGIARLEFDALLRGEIAVTQPLAVKIATFVGNTPEFWLDLQHRHDAWTLRTKGTEP